jgi:excinuclease ABC subunit C
LEEVLTRRFGHAEWQLPQLIVIDGGMTHMRAAQALLRAKGFDIDIVAVVKDERHRPRDIIGMQGIIEKRKKEILLANSDAHRFAIAYHKNLRGRHFLK